MEMATSPALRAAEPSADIGSGCFVCGPSHPTGLRIRYVPLDDGSIEARWNPRQTWEGFPGIIHGGIVSTVLDEAMSKAVAASGIRALTAELRVRFRSPLTSDLPVSIRGWVVDRWRRRIRTEAAITRGDGVELAHAWAAFLTLPTGGASEQMESDGGVPKR